MAALVKKIGAITIAPSLALVIVAASSIAYTVGIAHAQQPSDEQQATELLDAMRSSSWIVLGDPAAPVTYMFFDPSSAESRQTLDTLAPKIRNGSLQVRVILVAMMTYDSFGMVSGILQMDSPEEFLTSGGVSTTEIPLRRVSALPEHVVSAIRRNMSLVAAFDIPSLPFFGFAGAEGPAYINGIPLPAQFEDAEPPVIMPYYLHMQNLAP